MTLFFAQFLATSYLSKSHTLTDYSRYMLFLSICSPIFLFFNGNIRLLIATNVENFNERKLRFFHWGSLSIALLVCLGIGFVLYPVQFLWLMGAVALYRLFDGLFEYRYGYFLYREDSQSIGQSQIYRSVAMLFPIWVGLYLIDELSIAAFYTIIFLINVILYSTVDKKTQLVEPVKNKETGLSKIIIAGMPLAVIAVLDSLNVNIPKYILEGSGYSDEVGVFSSCFIFIQTVSFVGYSVSNSTLGSLRTYLENKNSYALKNLIWKSILVLLAIGLGFIGVIQILGKWLLTTFFTAEIAAYHQSFKMLSFVVIPMLFCTVFAFVLMALRKYGQYLIANITALLSMVMMAFYFVGDLGIQGIVYAFLIGYVVRMLLSLILYLYHQNKLAQT